MSPMPDIASSERPSAPLNHIPRAVAVHSLPFHPDSSAVITPSLVAMPSDSLPLYLALLTALSPLAFPLARYPPPAPLLLT